jgi:lysozyme
MTSSSSKLEDSVAFHEGFRAEPYQDTVGVWTIGYGSTRYPSGRLVGQHDAPVTELEARLMLRHDLLQAIYVACSYPWFADLSQPRQDVIVEMLYNLGAKRFDGFRRLHAALATQDYAQAALEMADSKWAHDVGDGPGGRVDRADRLEQQMRTGEYWRR